jgi:lipid II:glycine glycyltransferase (peptidoglycan interpeptide bridge formation enzyme)
MTLVSAMVTAVQRPDERATSGLAHSLDAASAASWYETLDRFRDASVFQTIAFCRATMPRAPLEQLVVRRGDEVIAAALVRIVPLPLTRTSIAYVLWGPLFHRWADERDVAALAYALAALREEYVTRRGLGLRIAPLLTRQDDAELIDVFLAHGYRRTGPRTPKHTFLLPLEGTPEQLRKALDQKWRNSLNSAERGGLTVTQATEGPVLDLFVRLYREMVVRKRLAEPGDIEGFLSTQASLPAHLRAMVFVALADGAPAAGLICSAVGHRGVYLFGATGAAGMKNKASYLLQWRALEWLRQRQCRVYDLHGANAATNPGVYTFKRGLAGKTGREVEMLGHFDAWDAPRVRWMMTAADRLNDGYKRLAAVYRRYRGDRG